MESSEKQIFEARAPIASHINSETDILNYIKPAANADECWVRGQFTFAQLGTVLERDFYATVENREGARSATSAQDTEHRSLGRLSEAEKYADKICH